MDKNIPEIYNLIQDLSWYFGNQGFDSECCEDLSLAEYMALKKVCDNKNITILEIGAALNITKSGISKIIDRLEKKKYVSKEHSAYDGRVCCVVATDKGVNAINKIADRYSQYLLEALSDEDSQSLEDIKKALSLMFDAVQKKGFLNKR